MIKQITLNTLPYVRFTDESSFYLVANDELTIKFNSPTFDLSKAYLRLKNGKITKSYAIKNEEITLNTVNDGDILFVGKLEMLVDLPEIGKVWHINSLSIKKFGENDFKATPIIAELKKSIADLTARVERLENKQKNPFLRKEN